MEGSGTDASLSLSGTTRTAGKMKTKHARMRGALAVAAAFGPLTAFAQAPEILSALDAGTRALGMGGATGATDVTPHAALSNPAGLGYITEPTLSVSIRSLPSSESRLSGDLADPSYSTERRYGRVAFSHLGYATPLGKGTFGLSYSVGGYQLEDSSAGVLNLSNGQRAVGYRGFTKAQTDLFTLAYGQATDRSSFGFGFVVANQHLNNREEYGVFTGNNQTGAVSRQALGTAQGIGLIAGWQAAAGENGMIGASVRTPISLKGDDEVTDLYGRIPGRASLGYAGKRLIRSEDYLTYALQLDYHFGGEKSGKFAREDKIGYGLGVEYSFITGGSRFPVRLGWQRLEALGMGFSNREGFSYGLGWRPENGRFGLDLNFFKDNSGGPADAALGITYRISK